MRYAGWLGAMAMLMVLAAGAQAEEPPPWAIVLARTAAATGPATPVTVPVDFAAVAQALGMKKLELLLPVTAIRELPGGKLEAVAAQFDPDKPGSPRGDLTLLLPAAAATQRVRVFFTPAFSRMMPPIIEGLSVKEEGGAITVANQHYRITHNPAKQGGLPSRLEFVGTGKVCDTFAINDRVYDHTLGGFRLGDDPAPKVEVLSRGPLRAAVRVTARYLSNDKAPETAPQATYVFTYYADSPLIRVQASLTQKSVHPWPECHLWEFNIPDESFTRWLAGKPPSGDVLKADQKGYRGNAYGALADGDNTVAVVGSAAMLYDGRGVYGTYVHGPWTNWSSTAESMSVALWIGTVAPAQAAATLEQAAAQANAAAQASVTVPTLETQRAELDKALRALPAATAARWRWLAQLADRAAGGPQALPQTLTLTKQLTALARKRAPVAAAEKLLRQTSGESLCLLSNAQVGWAFRRDGGSPRPSSCFDFASGRELLSATTVPLWEMELQRPDRSKTTVNAASATGGYKLVGTDQVELTWKLSPESSGARVVARMKLTGPQAAWNIAVRDLAPGWAVRAVAYPRLAAGQVGASPDDDYLLTPRGSGILTPAPLRENLNFTGMYPDGWAAFQLMAYYDQDCGLYFACHDPLAATKQIMTSRTTDGNGQMLTYMWYAPDMGVPGNGFSTSAPTVVRPFRGDWFDATQLYRAWAEKEAKWWPRETAWNRPDTPQWMREVCVWALGGGRPDECVKPVKEFAAAMGAPTAFHWYNWHEIPFDVKYPHYFPTKPGVAEGVKELQAAGVRVMPYINGRLWDTQLEDFQQTAIAAATKDEKGEPYIETYGSGAKLAPMCPTQKLWQDKVQEIVLRLTTEIGVDGVYIDQIGAAAPRLCMDKSHGHPLGGGHWWTEGGYWPLLTDLQAKLPAGKMITTECNAEAYARWMDAYLTWHWQYEGQVPAFSAIYAGRVQLFSRAYNGNEQLAHWMRIGQQLVFGEQLGWINPGIVKQAETCDFLSRAAKTRHAFLDFLGWGRMARPPAVQGKIADVTADWAWSGKWPVTTSALQRGAWWAQDGRLLLLFANVSGEPVSADLAFKPQAYGWPANAKVTLTPRPLTGTAPAETRVGAFRRALQLGPREIVALELKKQ